ncbi:DUF1109 domain-containing protein [Cystobacter ferrugineus]|uniref:DUF1109 domain-containing protein n=1 Tax=Cystobacter ferrugineus TaxID=83449 RepID=A0A1L9B1X6_9BACT|nr:DUF1109 domain-containing protein [Cystobacter ferrugineus]OJH36216.1 DUF1109 domain-containing protein [Cystobacter ferrugineus]
MMAPSLDTLLSREAAGDEAARARALAAVRAELARSAPVSGWRTQAARLLGFSVALTAAAAGVLWALGRTSGEVLWAHAPVLALLWAISAVCARAALAPRRRVLQWAGLGLALVGATALVLARDSVHEPSAFPEWICTLSQFGMGLLPGVVTLAALRGAAFQPRRALLGGLSAGTAGAFVGELACAQGRHHVLLYHLLAWALVSVTTLVVSRFLTPRSFAP